MNNDYIEQKKNTHLYFQLGENCYAVNTSNVLEIIKLPALDYPQKLPNNIIGLLKYNNYVINVIDIRFYLDIKVNEYSVHNDLLIVKTDEVIFGIITDKIMGILPMDTAYIDPIPFADNRTIIDALYKKNNDTIFIVNIYAIENILKQHNMGKEDINIPKLFPDDENSRNIMEKRVMALADKSALRLATTELFSKNKYISINLNNDYYCISLDYVKEVLKDTYVTNVPGTPDFIEGIMNLRGDYITVINLKKFLSLPSDGLSEKKPVVIISCNDLKLALLIDKINELFDFQEFVQQEASESYYMNEFIYNQTLYTELNIDKITSDKRIIVTDM